MSCLAQTRTSNYRPSLVRHSTSLVRDSGFEPPLRIHLPRPILQTNPALVGALGLEPRLAESKAAILAVGRHPNIFISYSSTIAQSTQALNLLLNIVGRPLEIRTLTRSFGRTTKTRTQNVRDWKPLFQPIKLPSYGISFLAGNAKMHFRFQFHHVEVKPLEPGRQENRTLSPFTEARTAFQADPITVMGYLPRWRTRISICLLLGFRLFEILGTSFPNIFGNIVNILIFQPPDSVSGGLYIGRPHPIFFGGTIAQGNLCVHNKSISCSLKIFIGFPIFIFILSFQQILLCTTISHKRQTPLFIGSGGRCRYRSRYPQIFSVQQTGLAPRQYTFQRLIKDKYMHYIRFFLPSKPIFHFSCKIHSESWETLVSYTENSTISFSSWKPSFDKLVFKSSRKILKLSN